MTFTTTKYSPDPDVLVQELEGQLVLLHLSRGRYYGLDAVGMRFWELLGQQAEMASIESQMLEQFDVSPQQLRTDLEALADKLLQAGLIVRVE